MPGKLAFPLVLVTHREENDMAILDKTRRQVGLLPAFEAVRGKDADFETLEFPSIEHQAKADDDQ